MDLGCKSRSKYQTSFSLLLEEQCAKKSVLPFKQKIVSLNIRLFIDWIILIILPDKVKFSSWSSLNRPWWLSSSSCWSMRMTHDGIDANGWVWSLALDRWSKWSKWSKTSDSFAVCRFPAANNKATTDGYTKEKKNLFDFIKMKRARWRGRERKLKEDCLHLIHFDPTSSERERRQCFGNDQKYWIPYFGLTELLLLLLLFFRRSSELGRGCSWLAEDLQRNQWMHVHHYLSSRE